MASLGASLDPSLAAALDVLAAKMGVVATGVPVTVPVIGAGREALRTAGAAASAIALAAAGSTARRITGYAADGCPQWPPGFAGSIAHTDDVAVAAVTRRSSRVLAVGVDIERAEALPADDARWVLASDERDTIAAHPQPDALATLLWSAKEAVFKAWSSATGGLGSVDPVDIVITIDPAFDPAIEPGGRTGAFSTRARGALVEVLPRFGATQGAFTLAAGYVVTLVVTAPSSEAG